MNINVNSGDGNSIFEIAHQYQKMQIRELMKNPEEIRQRIKDGSDTGSSKFIEEFDKVNNLLFQLKTKTNFKIEDVSEKRKAMMRQLSSDSNIDSDKLYADFINLDRVLTIKVGKDIRALNKTAFPAITQENKILYIAVFITALRDRKTKFPYQDDLIREFEPFITAFDKSLLSPEGVSGESYNRLASVNDSIPNLLGQVLSLCIKLKSQLTPKYMDWEKEIDQPKMTDLVEQAKTTQITYIKLSEMKAIVDYNQIYLKIEKPLGAIVELIFRMASGVGITGSSDEMRYEELKKVKKITPEIQAQIKDNIENKLDAIDPAVVYSFRPSQNDIIKFITESKQIIQDAYKNYIDDANIIQNYIEDVLEQAYGDLYGELGDVILEIEKRTEDKNKLTGSGKTTNTKTNRRKQLDLFVNTFHMKRFL